MDLENANFIGKLPVEMLMKIFRYLTSYYHLSFVSKRFYDITCEVNNKNIFLTLDNHFFEKHNCRELLLSIKETNRVITDVRCQFESYIGTELKPRMQETISIINKFSTTIKSLRFSSFINIEIADLLEVLSLVPNVEDLYLRFSVFLNQASRIVEKEIIELNLHKLRTLKVFCHGQDILFVFDKLPAGVLTELEFSGSADAFNVLIKRQTNIKNLKVHAADYPREVVDSINNLKLESLDWKDYTNVQSVSTILSKQTNLKILRLNKVDASIMNVIANRLNELERLYIDVIYSTPAAAIGDIANMKKLKHLMLQTSSTPLIESFTQLDNSRLTSLHIEIWHSIPVDIISAMAKSVPNLKVLRLGLYGLIINRNLLNAIRINFNFVEFLEIVYEEYGMINDSNLTEAFNPKLTEFYFKFVGIFCDENFLEKLIVDHPNLKKLALISNGRGTFVNKLTASMVKRILDGFPKLQSLQLCLDSSELTPEDSDSLDDYRSKLRFLLLRANGIIVKTFGRR